MSNISPDLCGGEYGSPFCTPFQLLYAQMNNLTLTHLYNPDSGDYSLYTQGNGSLLHWVDAMTTYMGIYC